METAAEQQPDTNSQCISSSLKPSRIASSKLDLDGARNNIHAKKGNVGFDCTQQREEDPGAENSLNTATNLSKEGGLRYRQKKSIQERSPERSPVQASPDSWGIEEGTGGPWWARYAAAKEEMGKAEASIRRRERRGFFSWDCGSAEQGIYRGSLVVWERRGLTKNYSLCSKL